MERFLISRLSSLGDVTCCLPAASALKTAFPESKVTWIVSPKFADVVRCCTAVDEVVEGADQFEGEFDAALDLQGLLKSAWPLARVKAKQKLGYHWQREGSWLFTQKVMPDPTSLHIVDQYVDVARAAGGQANAAAFNLAPSPEALESIREKLQGLNRFIVINPGAAWVTKRWPAQSFAAVIDAMSSHGVGSVLIGGRDESDRQSAEDTKSRCKSQPLDLVGQTNIKELIALLSLAEAHLGGDTGSTHLMAALLRPAIGLYSITKPQRSCPYGQIDRCHYDASGLDRISADPVIDTLREALA
jgi:heptosyltransferase I